jgi:ATP-dependent DNA helicase RecQ
VVKLLSWIEKLNGSGLIYVNKRKTAMELAKNLNDKYIKSDYYHAGLSMEDRIAKQEKWISTANSIMICTNAFGMGIDNPHTNYVIHFNMPNSLESYFQESGRAGRQGQASHSIVLFSLKDIVEFEEAIFSYPSIDEIKSLLTLLFNYYDIPFETGEGCRFEFVLEDFNDKYKMNPLKTAQGIQFLKDNNLIYLADEYYKQDEIQIIVDENTLNDFAESKPDYDQLLKSMIRTYEGLFFKRKVNLSLLSKNYHYNLTELKSMLRNLVKWGIIEYQEATNKPTIEFKISKLPLDSIPFDVAFYRDRKKSFVAQNQAVIDYLKNEKSCRNQLLLGYFDEQFERRCGICDHCLRAKSPKAMKDSDYIDIKDKLIHTLDNKLFVSIHKLIKLCKPYDEIYVRRVLDRLIELKLIEKGVGEVFKKS